LLTAPHKSWHAFKYNDICHCYDYTSKNQKTKSQYVLQTLCLGRDEDLYATDERWSQLFDLI